MSTAVYSDIDIELTKQTDGDITKKTDLEAVKNSLNNIINTSKGSRRMLPEFGSDIHKLLFEPLDEITAHRIGENILNAIKMWEDRIDIIGFHVHANEDNNQYECHLSFTLKGAEIEEAIDFILKTL